MGQGYEEFLGRKRDLEVRYTLVGKEADPRAPPHSLMQGSRPNWVFAADVEPANAVALGTDQFGVAPEFLDVDGSRWPDNVQPPLQGQAKIWIRFEAMRKLHGVRFLEGTRGYLTDGRTLLAECVVTSAFAL